MSKYQVKLELGESAEITLLADVLATIEVPNPLKVAVKLSDSAVTRQSAKQIIRRALDDLCHRAIEQALDQAIRPEPYEDFAAYDDTDDTEAERNR